MRKIKISLYILIGLSGILLIYFGGRCLLNSITIGLYNKDNYNDDLLKPLYFLNFNEPYIVYYNNGNINYRNEDYENAIKNYENSLENNPPKDRICDVRVNLSLSMVKNITSKDKNTILKKLKEAREVLYEDDCASPNGSNGESDEAEKLEEEIKKQEEETKKQSGNSDDENDENDDSDDGDDNNDDKQSQKQEQKIEKQIQQNRQEANESRKDEMDKYELYKDWEYYKGKSW